MALKGDLSTIGLADVFQMISMSQKKGTLVVQDQDSRKCIFFGEAGVKLLSTGRRKGLRLGDMLLRVGKISEGDLRDSLENAKIQKKLLGEILVESGVVTEAEIQGVVRSQIEEEIYDLFLWKKAGFEFIEGAPAEDLKDPDAHITQLTFDVNGLLLEAVRRADEWSLIARKIPSLDVIVVFASDAAREEDLQAADPAVRGLLERIDGRVTVAELVEATGAVKFDLCKVLLGFLERDRLRIVPPKETMEAAARSLEEGRKERAVRLCRGSVALAPRDPDVLLAAAKVVEGQGMGPEAGSYLRSAAGVMVEQGDAVRALELLNKAATLLPDDDAIRTIMLEAYSVAGDLEGGKRQANEIIERAFRGGNVSAVPTLCDRMLAADPADLRFRAFRAAANHRLGKTQEFDTDVAYLKGNLPPDPVAVTRIMAPLKGIVKEEAPAAEDHGTSALPSGRRSVPTRRRIRRGMVAWMLVGVFFLAAVAGYLKYEWDARRMLDERLEQSRALMSQERYAEARRALEEFAESIYRFSPIQTSKLVKQRQELDDLAKSFDQRQAERREILAKESLERLKALDVEIDAERTRNPPKAQRLVDEMRLLAESQNSIDYVKRAEEHSRLITEHLSEAFKLRQEAERLEAEGKFREAALAFHKLITDYSNTDACRGAMYPLALWSHPAGATVTNARTGLTLGKTSGEAIVFRMKPGERVRLLFDREGYGRVEREIQDKTIGELRVEFTEKMESWSLPLGVTISGVPAVLGDALYVGAAGRVYALGLAPKGVRWWESVEGNVLGATVSSGGRIFYATDRNVVGALDPNAAEGHRGSWKHPVVGRIAGPPCGTVEGDAVTVVTTDGTLHHLDASSGALRWEHGLTPDARIGPGVEGGVVVALSDGTLVALNSQDSSEELWRFSTVAALENWIVADGRVYVSGKGGRVFALDAGDGDKLWDRALPDAVLGRLALVEGLVLAGCRNGTLYLLKADDGEIAGTFKTEGALTQGATAAGGLALLGSEDGWFYAYDVAARKVFWRFRPKGRSGAFTAAVVEGKCAYFGWGDTVYALQLD